MCPGVFKSLPYRSRCLRSPVTWVVEFESEVLVSRNVWVVCVSVCTYECVWCMYCVSGVCEEVCVVRVCVVCVWCT